MIAANLARVVAAVVTATVVKVEHRTKAVRLVAAAGKVAALARTKEPSATTIQIATHRWCVARVAAAKSNAFKIVIAIRGSSVNSGAAFRKIPVREPRPHGQHCATSP